MRLPISPNKPLTIIIQGARCSGKSTLAQIIAKHLDSLPGIMTESAIYAGKDRIKQFIAQRDPEKILIYETSYERK